MSQRIDHSLGKLRVLRAQVALRARDPEAIVDKRLEQQVRRRFGDASLETIDRAIDAYSRTRATLVSNSPFTTAVVKTDRELAAMTRRRARAAGELGGRWIYVSQERFFSTDPSEPQALKDLIHESAHNRPTSLDDPANLGQRGIYPERMAEYAIDEYP